MATVEALERHRELVRGCSRCFPGREAPVVDLLKKLRGIPGCTAPGSDGGFDAAAVHASGSRPDLRA